GSGGGLCQGRALPRVPGSGPRLWHEKEVVGAAGDVLLTVVPLPRGPGLCLAAATSLFYAPAEGLSRGDGSPTGRGERFVSDIFQEVDEEVRREQLKKLWERYGVFLIAACVLLVVAVGGWRTYEWWEAKKAAEASSDFQAAVALSAEGKNKEAEEAFAKLASSGTASYRMLARFREA